MGIHSQVHGTHFPLIMGLAKRSYVRPAALGRRADHASHLQYRAIEVITCVLQADMGGLSAITGGWAYHGQHLDLKLAGSRAYHNKAACVASMMSTPSVRMCLCACSRSFEGW